MDNLDALNDRLSNLEKRMDRLEKELLRSKQTDQMHLEQQNRLTVKPELSQPMDINDDLRVPSVQKEKNTGTHQSFMLTKRERGDSNKKRKNVEVEIGTKWFNIIGIIAIFIAIGYFIQMAWVSDLFSDMGKVLFGLFIGSLMLLGGDFLVKKYKLFAVSLIGGGMGVMVYSNYAAFASFELINEFTAFLLYGVLMLISIFLALRHDSAIIAQLGIVTGFLTPSIIGDAFEGALFLPYVLILNLCMVALSYFKPWRSLLYVSFFATNILFWFWYASNEEMSGLMTIFTISVITVLMLAYLTVSIWFHFIKFKREREHGFAYVFIWLNALSFYGLAFIVFADMYDSLNGIYAILIGLVYLAVYYTLFNKMQKPIFLEMCLGVALMLFTIAITVQLKGDFLVLAWSIEAALLAYMLKKNQDKLFFVATSVVSVVSVIGLLVQLIRFYQDETGYLDINGFVFMLSGAFLLLMVTWMRQNMPRESLLFAVIVNLLLMFFFMIMVGNYFNQKINDMRYDRSGLGESAYQNLKNISRSFVMLLYSLALMVVGFMKKRRGIRIFAMVIFVLVIFKVFIFDLSSLEDVYRVLSFVGLGVTLLMISFAYQKYKTFLLGDTDNEN